MSDLLTLVIFPYGASELKKHYQKHLAETLVLVILLHVIAISSYRVGLNLLPKAKINLISHSSFKSPAEIYIPLPPPLEKFSHATCAYPLEIPNPTKFSVGVPAPIPDVAIEADHVLASQIETTSANSNGLDGGGFVEGIGSLDGEFEKRGPHLTEGPIEKPPIIVKLAQPIYPEVARQAGLEGTVWLKLWVDRQGRVKKVVVFKSEAKIFEQAAISAAQQFVFTPAFMSGGPVAVWVAVPFKFRLK